MKIHIRTICLVHTAILLAQQSQMPSAVPVVPRLVRVSSSFQPANGMPLGTTEGVTLAIYRDETGGSPLWQETQNVTLESDGRFTVLLGASQTEGIPSDLFRSPEPRWLGILFNRSGEIEQQRIRLASVPYALRASDADALGGRPASAYALAENGLAADTTGPSEKGDKARAPTPRASSGAVDFIAKFISSADVGNSIMFESSGRIGIGTTTPNDRLHAVFSDGAGGAVGYSVQNMSGTPSSYSGMQYFDHLGVLGVFQGFNNSTHEYRVNNIAPNGVLNLMIGGAPRLHVANNGNIGIGTTAPVTKLDVAGSVKAAGGIIFGDGTQQTTASVQSGGALNTQAIALLRWCPANLTTQFTVGNAPVGVAFDGANIWVANSGADSLTKIRANDGFVLGQFSVGSKPFFPVFDGANVWVTNLNGNSVTKVRASDGVTLGTFAVGLRPVGITFDGANVWVTNAADNTVMKLRASDGARLGTFVTGNNPAGLVFDGANIWVSNELASSVTKLRASDGAALGTFPVGSTPFLMAFDGGNIWVANSGANSVTKLRAADGANLGTFTVGNGPSAIAFDGNSIWVTNQGTGSNSVTKLRASDGATVGTFPAGISPGGVAFDGANIWVANQGSNTVSKL